jgi:hypothetical protein
MVGIVAMLDADAGVGMDVIVLNGGSNPGKSTAVAIITTF